MLHHASVRYTTLVLVIVLVGVLIIPSSTPAIAQQGQELLQNPDFEGNYVAIGGDSTKQVAPSWQPWHLPPPAGADPSINLEPDYQPAPTNRVLSGSAAQEYNTFFATHDGGVFQRVPVTAGENLRFSANLYIWSSATFEDPNKSIQPQGVKVSVGIDPNGGTDPTSGAIVWSTPVEYYDEYREITVSTVSLGTSVTVYVRSTVTGAIGVNNIYVDKASLVSTGSVPVTPTTPAPTTPAPTTPAPTTPGPTTPAPTTPAPTTPVTITVVPTTPASVTPTPPYQADLPNQLEYMVVAGDTVIDIATRFNSSVDAITQANGLAYSGLIYVGQRLIIPVPAGTGQPSNPVPVSTVTPVTPAPPAGGGEGSLVNGIYVVQSGDTLFRVGLRFNVTVDTIAQCNGILNPNAVYVGQQLRIPGAGATCVGGTTGTGGQQPVPAQPIYGTGGAYTNYVIHLVQPGENIFRIGLRYNLTWDRIAQANGLYNPNQIFVGQRLIIPR
ncbi:MAG: LysM peptidoglycan-binding domain-containing protein [Chloroflexi bacterium]|nr:LysM peptidoglycan-binding domain-containing protein [Chloroflexota bacterium]